MAKQIATRMILNPISGVRSKQDIPDMAQRILAPAGYDLEICLTQSAQHARELALEAVEQNLDLVIAAGGDGTLNQVGGALQNTQMPMAIVPLGSGNGLARALNIPLKPNLSLKAIIGAVPLRIDTGKANDIPFLNVCGFGFDAHISSEFAKAGKRGFGTYASISIREISSFQPKTYTLSYQQGTTTHRAFILAICNGPQYGSNAFIAPAADLCDGKLDVTILTQVNWLNMVGLTSSLFAKTLNEAKEVTHFTTDHLTIHQPIADYVNIDGEPIWFEEEININLLPKSLTLMVPKHDQ